MRTNAKSFNTSSPIHHMSAKWNTKIEVFPLHMYNIRRSKILTTIQGDVGDVTPSPQTFTFIQDSKTNKKLASTKQKSTGKHLVHFFWGVI